MNGNETSRSSLLQSAHPPRRIVAFRISASDNGTFLFPDASVGSDISALREAHQLAGRESCQKCGMLLKDDCSNAAMKLTPKARRLDLGSTYDNRHVAKESFAQMCEELGFTGAAFLPLTREPGFFHMICTSIIPLDTRYMPWIERSKRCKTCGLFQWASLGGSPIYIKHELETDFAWSDERYAAYIGIHPLTIVSPRVKGAIQQRKLRSVDFHPVYLAE